MGKFDAAGPVEFQKAATRVQDGLATDGSRGGVWRQLRGVLFTAKRALGLREQLGAVPVIIGDVNQERFRREVPDLVKFDWQRASQYAPIVTSTNKQVSAVSPDIRKRTVASLIDAAIPDRHSCSSEIAHRAHARMGTTFYRGLSAEAVASGFGDARGDR